MLHRKKLVAIIIGNVIAVNDYSSLCQPPNASLRRRRHAVLIVYVDKRIYVARPTVDDRQTRSIRPLITTRTSVVRPAVRRRSSRSSRQKPGISGERTCREVGTRSSRNARIRIPTGPVYLSSLSLSSLCPVVPTGPLTDGVSTHPGRGFAAG